MFERDTNEENNEKLRQSLAKEGTSPEKSDTQEPQIENIGIDGSQRFSDIRDEGGLVGLNNNSESMIVFNPKKEIKSNNPNLFSQVMSS